MAASDQNKYIQFVNLLNSNNAFGDVNDSVISPTLNYICIVSKLKDAFLYLLPSADSNVEHFWHCPSKVQRCFFSEDGKNLLMILNVNSFQIYVINEKVVTLAVQIKATVLAELMKPYKIDFSAACQVEPLKLKGNEIIIIVDKKLILNIEWGRVRKPSVKYFISLEFYKDLFLNDKFIFVLHSNGIIDGYHIVNGQKCREHINSRPDSEASCGENFFKLAVDSGSKILAVVDQDQETILFDASDMFDDEKKNASVVRAEAKKEKWIWPYKVRKPVGETKISDRKILGKVSAPPGLVVSHLQFSLKGLFAFYCILGESKSISFKVIDETSGDVLYNFEGLVESKVISGGPLPLVMTDSILSMCLGALCNDYFIMKLCEAIPNFGFSKELERTLLGQSRILGSVDFHPKFLNVILGLHLNVFNSNLKSLSEKKSKEKKDSLEVSFSEKKMTERVEELFKVVLEYREDDKSENAKVKESMSTSCFRHAVRLLDSIHAETKGNSKSDLFSSLLRHVVVLFENVRGSDPLKDEWVSWSEMTDSEIIREAATVGAVALAHVFFATDREWPVDEVESKFKAEAHRWILELISSNELERTKIALANLGCNPIRELKSLCLESNDPSLRDRLANYLSETGDLSEELSEAWHFGKNVDAALSSVVKRCRAFERKMSVSARDRTKAIAFKLPPFNGCIELATVLTCSKEWREDVSTEVYFNTGDILLEKTLNKETCWKYLLEMNQIELLKNWIDVTFDSERLDSLYKSSDYLTRSFYNLFYGWTVTEEMLESAKNVKCMTATKDSVLDVCASHGLFSVSEKKSLKKIICRLENNSLLSAARSVFSKPNSNVPLADFDEMLFKKCIRHSLKPVALICLSDSTSVKETSESKTESPWTDAWKSFCSWENDKTNEVLIKEAIGKSMRIGPPHSDELPFLEAAMALLEEKEISDIIIEEGSDCSLLRLPLVEINRQTSRGINNKNPDVLLYDLLSRSNVPIDKLFLWQSQNKRNSDVSSREAFGEFPHFNHQVLGMNHGFKLNLDYMYYLKQGRPSFSCNLFIVESLRTQRRLTTKMIKRACGTAHGLALKHWRDNSVGSACVAFITMLGDIASSNILRIHLAAIACTSDYLSSDERYYISTLVRGIASKEMFYIQEMASLLESSIMTTVGDEKGATLLERWYLAVSFCNTHGLPLPTLLLRHLARNREWFVFVLCLDVFKYPYEQAIDLIEEIDSKILKSHLIRALTRTTLKLSTTSPSKSPPKILLEPENTGKDETVDSETPALKENKDIFQSFVTNIYTEVLNTIQTFTDKNIVLPWSCEQDPDGDVLLTLLKCESEPDTSKSLLMSSIELQSPVLAVLATCFQSDNVFPNLIAWLVSSVPTSMPRIKRREEAQQLIDRAYGPKEVETLFVHFFSTGYFQTFFRGMNLFMAENPFTLFLKAVFYGVVLLDFKISFELLKEFVVEMSHFRVKEPTLFFSKSWILKVASQCLENLLTRTDLENSIKRQFLRILAESDLASLDPSFPNYLLWSQICDILESSETSLDFVQSYDVSVVSEELQNCLDELTKNFQFTQALEICSLLSLNKDKCVLSMWKHQFSIKTEGNVQNLCADSSLAFKDENVNPNSAASFYYDVASHFQNSSPESLKNKYLALEYCLRWRRLIEDTSSASFREESDSIELEKWKCCIEPDFDIGILKSSGPADASHSLLVSIWSSSKVLVRSQVLDDFERERVEDLINMFLDQEDLQKALRLSAFFKSNNSDLVTVTSCLKVIHGEVTPSELTKFTCDLSSTPKKLWSRGQHLDGVDRCEHESVPSREQHQMLFLLDKLCQSVNHGRSLANKVLVCYRLSVNLDTTFKDIASERDYLALLPRSLSLEGVDKFGVARDLITLADLPDFELAKFLKDKIVTAIVEYHSSGMLVPVSLWDVSLDSDFHSIINLMRDDPSLLGFELLQASVNLPCNAGVDVLIRAHDCFAASCNVEGIGRVLRRARILASHALKEEQWQYLVKLLIGIERYTDMSYIFQMLKDNGQFEQLLRKGMQKVPGLHVAISEFLQRHCPQDRELGKMVAAHFGLPAKLAMLWQEEADEIILKLPFTDNVLKDSSKTRQALNLAMDNYSHAVQWFLQAGKLNRALKVAHQAQMVALQISLLGGPVVLGIRSRAQLQALANENLSVAQVMLLSRAYDLEPDWTTALHERWILKGDKTFYADLKSSNLLSPHLIYLHSSRYDSEQLTNSKAKDRMKQLLVTVSGQQQSPLLKDLNRNQVK